MTNSAVMEDKPRRRRGWWMVTAREARQHAIILAVATWAVSIITTTTGTTGRTSLVGLLNAPDFVHFYTFGTLAREGRIREAYDWQAFHAKQVSLVPESAKSIYPPVYPPQAALIFIPLSVLSFELATAVWAAITVGLYGLIVWAVWRGVRDHLPDRRLVFAAAVGFPPFWQVVMNGQVTIVVLLAFFFAWLALERRRHFLAGAALGLLAIKPQFALPFAAIVLVRRDWRMMAGAALSVGLQALCVWWALGAPAFSGYGAMLPTIVAHADELEAKPFQSHSIRAITRLLPGWIGTPLWIAAVAVVIWKTARVWLTSVPMRVRLGVAVLASVLVNPHLIVYDAAILVLPLIWFGAWAVERRAITEIERYGALVYGLFLTFLAPTAAVIRIQVSVLLMLALFWSVQSRAVRHHNSVCA